MWILRRSFKKDGVTYSVESEKGVTICTVEEETAASLIRSAPEMKRAVLMAIQRGDDLPIEVVEHLLHSLGSPAHPIDNHYWVDLEHCGKADIAYAIARVAGLFPKLNFKSQKIEISGGMYWDLLSTKHLNSLTSSIEENFKVKVTSRNKMGTVTYSAKATNDPMVLPLKKRNKTQTANNRELAIFKAAGSLVGVHFEKEKSPKLFIPRPEKTNKSVKKNKGGVK